MNRYSPRITLEEVGAAKPGMIFYGANTCWWTHRREDLYKHPETGLPCDPRGGMLFETDDTEGFLRSAEESASYYGEHGLKAFEAAHHGNIIHLHNGWWYPWCFKTWQEYNNLISMEKAASSGSEHGPR